MAHVTARYPINMRWLGPALALLLLGGSGAPGQEAAKPAPAAEKAAAGGDAKAPEKAEPAKEAKEKNIDETVKDFQKLTGFFTFYRNKKGTTDTLMMEIPQERLGQLLMLQVTASTGTAGTPASLFHGAPLRDLLFRLEKVDDSKILFIQRNLGIRAPTDAPTRRSLERAFPGTILQSFEIKARQPERQSVLIDVSDLFKTDIADLGGRFDRAGYALDRAGSYIDQLKVLPENAIVRSVYQANRKGPAGAGPRSFSFAVSFDLYTLPTTSYRPRLGDTRVGYFTTAFEDQSDAGARDKMVNYIVRWNLEKADPAAPLSPPKKPIVMWLDNAIPEKYRAAVREGLLMWNPAFERVGIKDAIVVKQMPDDAEWDIADVRYNVVRWTTGIPFAVALFRANPLTGEVLNASINFDAGFASSGAGFFETIIDPLKAAPRKAEAGTYDDDPRRCTYAADSCREAYFGELAFQALQTADAPFDREAFVHAYIREVIAHELGHNLGLRHNFIASTESTFGQLGDAAWVKQKGVAASVMDYNPPNLAAIKRPGVAYYSDVVGSYDRWAIAYGYTPLEAATPEAERPALARIASQCNWPGHAFQSDEMGDAYDPRITRFDLGKNPLDWTARSLELSRILLTTLGQRAPKPGASYFEFTRDFNALVSRSFSAASYTSRFIGGLCVNSNYRGDAAERPPLVPVDGAQQRQALQMLVRFAFAENSFAFPKAYFAMLTGNPNVDGNQPEAAQREFPVFNTFTDFQRGLLQRLFTAERLTRLANNEFRSADPKDTLTMAALFRTVGDAIWTEVGTGREPSALRRSLQVDHLSQLIDLAVNRDPKLPADAVTLAWEQLRRLDARLTAALPTARGEYAPAHLREAQARIRRAMEAKPVARP